MTLNETQELVSGNTRLLKKNVYEREVIAL